MIEKKLTISDYGIYIMSVGKLQTFMKSNKIRSRRILSVFQKNHDLYIKSIVEGVWIPIVPIISTKYILDNTFSSEEWIECFEHKHFNLNIIDETYWVGSFGNLLNINFEQFLHTNTDSISYQTLDGVMLYSAFKYQLGNGNYNVSIKGFRRKNILNYPFANYGFSFDFNKVNSFTGYNDPRNNERYSFNFE